MYRENTSPSNLFLLKRKSNMRKMRKFPVASIIWVGYRGIPWGATAPLGKTM